MIVVVVLIVFLPIVVIVPVDLPTWQAHDAVDPFLHHGKFLRRWYARVAAVRNGDIWKSAHSPLPHNHSPPVPLERDVIVDILRSKDKEGAHNRYLMAVV